ncbi:hypothetical protein HanRHA438_Chr10g0465071 [Helianthus annuus]|nr:hypothetical protein HanRHA438_Chr10g0465071 [Helianthus annuus]
MNCDLHAYTYKKESKIYISYNQYCMDTWPKSVVFSKLLKCYK